MTNKQPVIDAALGAVGHALDQGAWLNLCKSNPELARAVEAAVNSGISPADIRYFVMRHTNSPDFAKFVEQAASWLAPK